MAKKTNDFRDKINQFADSIKNKPSDTPIQEVRPVLMDRIKLHAFTERKTMKEVCNEALKYYMAAMGKPRKE